MIKADVKGLIKIENIRIIKKPLNHFTSMIYFTITLFGHRFKVTKSHLLSLIIGSTPTVWQDMFTVKPFLLSLPLS